MYVDGEIRARGIDQRRWKKLGKKQDRRSNRRRTVVVSEIWVVDVKGGIYLRGYFSGVAERHTQVLTGVASDAVCSLCKRDSNRYFIN